MALNRTTLFTSYVGRDLDRNRVFVTVETEPQQNAATAMTTEHEPVPAGTLNLSISYWTLRYRSRTNQIESVGSGPHGILLSVAAEEIAPGWTEDDIMSLARISRNYHLSGVQAACAHMNKVKAHKAYDALSQTHQTWKLSAAEMRELAPDAVCSETDYTYGRAWLTKIIPADVWAELHRLSELPHGTIVHGEG